MVSHAPNLSLIFSPTLLISTYQKSDIAFTIAKDRYINGPHIYTIGQDPEIRSVESKLGGINLPLGLKYYFINQSAYKLSVSGQVSYFLPILMNSITITRPAGSTPEKIEQEYKNLPGFGVSIAYEWNKLSLRASYSSLLNVSKIGPSNELNGFGIGLGYRLR